MTLLQAGKIAAYVRKPFQLLKVLALVKQLAARIGPTEGEDARTSERRNTTPDGYEARPSIA
jgi:DNA-binding response OmpR family regulator